MTPGVVSRSLPGGSGSGGGRRSGVRNIVCTHYLEGMCALGDACEYLHQFDVDKMPPCPYGSKCNRGPVGAVPCPPRARSCGTGGVSSSGIRNGLPLLFLLLEASLWEGILASGSSLPCAARIPGQDCPFKHTAEEEKIECVFYRQGFCAYGPFCRFRHIRRAPVRQSPRMDFAGRAPGLESVVMPGVASGHQHEFLMTFSLPWSALDQRGYDGILSSSACPPFYQRGVSLELQEECPEEADFAHQPSLAASLASQAQAAHAQVSRPTWVMRDLTGANPPAKRIVMLVARVTLASRRCHVASRTRPRAVPRASAGCSCSPRWCMFPPPPAVHPAAAAASGERRERGSRRARLIGGARRVGPGAGGGVELLDGR
jgi:hypothetical protein